jgi:hypothetical protein
VRDSLDMKALRQCTAFILGHPDGPNYFRGSRRVRQAAERLERSIDVIKRDRAEIRAHRVRHRDESANAVRQVLLRRAARSAV